MKSTINSALAILLAGALTLMATSVPIGTVQATGEFRVNHATVYGNSTLFDGAVIETAAVRSDVSLSSNGHIALAPNSKTRVYSSYAVLESGAADVNAGSYRLDAAKLSISGNGAQVVMDSASKVRVGALSSPVEVRSGDMLIARVFPGHPLEFEGGGQGGASGPVTITGTLQKEGDHYTITDSTTNVTYQVQGKNLDGKVGKKVKVTGSIVPGAVAGAVPVIAVTSIVVAAAVAGGLSAAAIAGIAVAGATGLGLGVAAANGAFSSSSTQ